MQPSDLLKPYTFLLPTCFLYLRRAFFAVLALTEIIGKAVCFLPTSLVYVFLLFKLVPRSKTEHLHRVNILLVTRVSYMSNCLGVF